MRYEIFILKKMGTDQHFEEMEQIVGSVVADSPEAAKQIAQECFKEAKGQKLVVKEAPRKGVFT